MKPRDIIEWIDTIAEVRQEIREAEEEAENQRKGA